MALWVIGRDVEPALGRGRFLAVYLVSLLGGSTAVMLLTAPGANVAGASGAVFGLMGALAVLLRRLRIPLGQVGGLIAVNLAITFLLPGISVAGHLGGLLTGAVATAALVYAPAERRVPVQAGGAGGPHAACCCASRRAAAWRRWSSTARRRGHGAVGAGAPARAPPRRRPPGRRRGPAGRTRAAARAVRTRRRRSPASSTSRPQRRTVSTRTSPTCAHGWWRGAARPPTVTPVGVDPQPGPGPGAVQRGERQPDGGDGGQQQAGTVARSDDEHAPRDGGRGARPGERRRGRREGLHAPTVVRDGGSGCRTVIHRPSFTERNQLSTDVVHTGDGPTRSGGPLSATAWSSADRSRSVRTR